MTLLRAWHPASYRYSSELTPPLLNPAAHDKLVAAEYLDAMAARLRPGTTVPIAVAVIAGAPPQAIRRSRSA